MKKGDVVLYFDGKYKAGIIQSVNGNTCKIGGKTVKKVHIQGVGVKAINKHFDYLNNICERFNKRLQGIKKLL